MTSYVISVESLGSFSCGSRFMIEWMGEGERKTRKAEDRGK